MGVGNIFTVLRAKWWIIALVAITGALIGAFLAVSNNRDIRPRWRGEAPVTFISLATSDSPQTSGSKGGNSTSSEISAQAEGVRARLLLEEELTADPRLSILVDRDKNILLFAAVGRDGDETLARALELRSQYQDLSAEVLNIDQIEESINSLFSEIETLRADIDLLTVKEPEPEDPEITSARSVLVNEIATLNERQTQLRIWVLSPELRPTEDEFFNIVDEETSNSKTTETTIAVEPVIVGTTDLENEYAENARVLSRLDVQLTLIPEEPVVEELSVSDSLTLEALQAREAELQTQYVELLQVADGRSPGGFLEEPTAIDVTGSTRPVGLFALAGAFLGALLASVIVIGFDRARKTVWLPSSLEEITALGMIDRNRSDGLPQDIWYPTSVSVRRRQIQAFRATIDAITEEQSAIIGFFGVKTSGAEVGSLAADLATAYTVAGRNVLLIDANAYDPNTLAEYGDPSSSLTRILVRDLQATDATDAIGELIDATPQVIPHLTSLHIDAATHDPIDAIASPNARRLMDVARERFDVVIVAGPAISDPLSDAVARRIDFAVLVGTAGKTTTPQLATATAILTERRTVSPGVVILSGHKKALMPSLTDRLQGTRSSVTTTVSRWRAPEEDGTEVDVADRPPEQSMTDASGIEDLVEQTSNAGSKVGPSQSG
jgi:hypothetical protein